MTPMLPFDEPAQATPAKPNPVKRERQRLNAAARRVLARLREGPALNFELCTPAIGGLRAIGRVDELRREGWDVRKEHVSGGTWRYTLHLPLTL